MSPHSVTHHDCALQQSTLYSFSKKNVADISSWVNISALELISTPFSYQVSFQIKSSYTFHSKELVPRDHPSLSATLFPMISLYGCNLGAQSSSAPVPHWAGLSDAIAISDRLLLPSRVFVWVLNSGEVMVVWTSQFRGRVGQGLC